MYRKVVPTTCPICGTYGLPKAGSNGANAFGVCPSCWDKIPGWNASFRYNYLHHCEKHDYWYFNGSSQESAYTCPKCRVVYCPICHEEKPIRMDRAGRANRWSICEDCWNSIDGWDAGASYNYLNHCEPHNYWWFTHSQNARKDCPICAKESARSASVKLYFSLISDENNVLDESKGLIIAPYKPAYDKDAVRTYGTSTCIWCGRDFIKFGPRSSACGCCYSFSTCKSCGERFIVDRKHASKDHAPSYCSLSCAVTGSHKDNKIVVVPPSLTIVNAVSFEEAVSSIPPIASWISVNAESAASFNHPGCWAKLIDGVPVDLMATSSIDKEWNKITAWLANPPNEKYTALKAAAETGSLSFALVKETATYAEASAVELALGVALQPIWWKPAPDQIAILKQKGAFDAA